MKIAIYLPVYNGELFIEKNLLKVIQFTENQMPNSKVFVVDDASNDSTHNILLQLKKSGANFEFIHFENGPSRRENLAYAMSCSNADWIAFIDSDLPFELSEMKRLVQIAITENVIVIGSRYLKGKTSRGFFRFIISKVYNHVIQFIFRTGIKDHSCGLKVFKTTDFKKINKHVSYDSSGKRGWFWDTEVIYTAKKLKIKVREEYINWVEQKHSTFSINREIKIVIYLIINYRRFFFPFKSK